MALPVSAPVSPTCSTSPAPHVSPVCPDVPALLGELFCPFQPVFVFGGLGTAISKASLVCLFYKHDLYKVNGYIQFRPNVVLQITLCRVAG